MEGVPARRKGRKVAAALLVEEGRMQLEDAVVEQEGEARVVIKTKTCRAILCGLQSVSDAGTLGNRARNVLAAA